MAKEMATKFHIKFRNTNPPPAPYLGIIPKQKQFFYCFPYYHRHKTSACFSLLDLGNSRINCVVEKGNSQTQKKTH